MKKKVLILCNSSGGLYDFRNDFVKNLLAEYEVYISMPDDVKEKELVDEGCKIIKTPINRRGINPLEDFKLFLHYIKILKSLKPDMVATYTIKPNIYGGFACRVRKVPYITTITGLGGAFDKTGLFLKLVVFLYRQGVKGASCIFFQNTENKGIFEKYGIKGKSQKLVMGSGVDLVRHIKEDYPKRDDIHFLFVGRIMKERGILEYLEAAKQLSSSKVHFDILGACDEDYQNMLDEFEKNNYIHQLGFHTEVHGFLKDSDCIVVASFHEGMSNSLIEAAATGRPVIASNIFGCKEAVEDKVTGLLFTPGNSDELIDVMKQFISMDYESRNKMGKAGREKMEKEFDRKIVTASYMATVHELLK